MKSAKEIMDVNIGWVANDKLNPKAGQPTRMRIKGELGYRIHKIVNRLQTEIPYSREYIMGQMSGEDEAWSNFPRFHGDITGRWILAMTYAHSDKSSVPEHVQSIVDETLALQNDDGSFGFIQYKEEPLNMHKAYGNAWTMKGLAQFAITFNCKKAAQAAIRVGDFFVDSFDIWAATDMGENNGSNYAVSRSCYFHAFDGLMTLYRLTQDKKYLDLCESFIPLLTKLEDADHAHMYLTSRRGMLEFYKVTNDKKGIKKLEKELSLFREKHIFETGGAPERICQDDEERANPERKFTDEGCTLFDWLILNMELFNETGDEEWLHSAIFNLENQIYLNQEDNGGFGDINMGPDYPRALKEAPWCCSIYGPFGLLEAARSFITLKDGILNINHLVSGDFEFGNASVSIEVGEDFIELAGDGLSKCKINFPFWVESSFDEIDLATCATSKIFFKYKTWTATRLRTPQKDDSNGAKALFYGPWIMGHRFNDPIPTLTVQRDNDGFITNGKTQWLYGSIGCGKSVRLILPSNQEVLQADVSRGIRQNSGDFYCYPLKEKDSVWCSWTNVNIK